MIFEDIQNLKTDFENKFLEKMNLVKTQSKKMNIIEHSGHIDDLIKEISSPFNFVVVGEVKSGKSSFINALLKADVCKVGARPTTDIINKIEYGNKEEEKFLTSEIKQIFFPSNILKYISIIDTPGTNTVVENHQRITEEFIPKSDLIIFVFSSKNPHTKSAWEFLDFVSSEWKKNVIFIMQQTDIASELELKDNLLSIEEYAKKHGIEKPKIFPVSAKLEIENSEEKGFRELYKYISSKLMNEKNYSLKIESILNTFKTIIAKFINDLNEKQNIIESEKKVRLEIKKEIEALRLNSEYELGSLVDALVKRYQEFSFNIKNTISDEMKLLKILKRQFSSTFKKEKSVKVWLEKTFEDFQENLKNNFNDIYKERIESYTETLKKNMLRINSFSNSKLKKKDSSEEIFYDIAANREKTIKTLEEKLEYLLKKDGFFTLLSDKNINEVGKTVALGSTVAIIGVILNFSTQLALFDITGGILATTGILTASIFSVFKRNSLLKNFEKEIDSSIQKFEEELKSRLNEKNSIIYLEIDKVFSEMDKNILIQEQEIKPLIRELESILEEIENYLLK